MVQIPMKSLEIVNSPNPSCLAMSLVLTKPLREMITSNLLGGGGGKARPTRKADNLTAVSKPIV
jgi:hypothetical protein